jgi:prepilin-type N-terminal cleavage/methylation domain-containing protein
MKTHLCQQKGFTLIEMIAVLLLVGIMAALAGLGIVTAVQGYIFSKDNAAISEKAQLAVARINRELLECYNCTGSGTLTSLTYYNTLGQRTIQMNGTDIEISGDKLLDTVKANSLALTYNTDNSISVQFSIARPGGPDLTFTSKVYPRNTAF